MLPNPTGLVADVFVLCYVGHSIVCAFRSVAFPLAVALRLFSTLAAMNSQGLQRPTCCYLIRKDGIVLHVTTGWACFTSLS